MHVHDERIAIHVHRELRIDAMHRRLSGSQRGSIFAQQRCELTAPAMHIEQTTSFVDLGDTSSIRLLVRLADPSCTTPESDVPSIVLKAYVASEEQFSTLSKLQMSNSGNVSKCVLRRFQQQARTAAIKQSRGLANREWCHAQTFNHIGQ